MLAAFGAVALTRDRADALTDELTRRGAMSREEARDLVEDLAARWRGDALRFGQRAGAGVQGLARELGFASQEELNELALRVAQLEHRLRLLEGQSAVTAVRPPRAVED